MKTLCVILARAGSKGLPGKNVIELAGRPMIRHTIDHARAAKSLDRIVVSTDGDEIARIARDAGVEVIMRPADLASDTATVDAAARHAVETLENSPPPPHKAGTVGPASGEGTRDIRRSNQQQAHPPGGREVKFDAVVILYANVPLRPATLIDDAIAKLAQTGCDSVQSICPVGKHHPYWMKRLDGDKLLPYEPNNIYRRQDLPPVYQLDGGIIAVARKSLFTVREGEPHVFLGTDRRAVVTPPGSVVDVDTQVDLQLAETKLRDGSCPQPPALPGGVLVVGGREIGRGHRTLVIAELGVNHDGALDLALGMTRIARECDADAVKLQLFDPRKLLSAEAELAAYQQGVAGDPFAMLEKLQLSVEDMLKVKALARQLGLAFIVTPFSIENLDDMRRLDPDAVKIASPDCVNLPLIRAMQTLNKPMIASLGASTAAEQRQFLPQIDDGKLAVMQCTSAYPTPADSSKVGDIRGCYIPRTGVVGYSDHTTEAAMGALAVAHGASIVEKHLTYDRNAPGPDHAASFDPPTFAAYVRLVRIAESQRSSGSSACLQIEQDVRRVSRQSVCAVRDLKAGTVIRREDVTVKRPGTGVPAAKLDQVVGRKLKRDVKANRLLHDDDVNWE